MTNAISNALSGLAAASQRLEVAANNIANQSSTSKVGSAPTPTSFLPQDIVQISQAGGGVRALQRTSDNPTTQLYNPSDANADKNGEVLSPNVDVATQLINAKIASYDYKANLKVIQAQQNIDENLLDIFS